MVYIWVRTTTDWADEAAFLAQLDPLLERKVEAWNATFDMPFHVFRHRVREIARLNHSRVAGAACTRWAEVPEGELVLPVDDDDWFAPDAARVLEAEREAGVRAYHWHRSFLEVPTSFRHRLHLIARRTVGLRMPYLFTTNSYALVKGPGSEPLAVSHVQASRWAETAPPGSVKKVERWLSTMNRTLASQTQLRLERSTIGRPELIHKLRCYRRLYRRPPPEELAWSAPYRGMMSDLMGELGIRGR